MTLLTLAQARLSPCSGFAQAGSPLLTLIIFSRLRRSMLDCFSSSRGGPELVPFLKSAVLTFLLHIRITFLSAGDFCLPSLALTPPTNTPTVCYNLHPSRVQTARRDAWGVDSVEQRLHASAEQGGHCHFEMPSSMMDCELVKSLTHNKTLPGSNAMDKIT